MRKTQLCTSVGARTASPDRPGRLEGLDGTALKVKEYEIDTGFVTVLTRSGCELRVGNPPAWENHN